MALLAVGLLAAGLLAAPAAARITSIGQGEVELFAAGTLFGEVGAYERVKGVATGELDPADPRNAGIVNLDKAPRNAQGRVEYAADWFVLRPADPARGNGKLVFEVTNRGRKLLPGYLLDAGAQSGSNANDPRQAADVGNGLLLRLGYTLAWSGWDADAPRAKAGMAMKVPVPTDHGAPIIRTIRDELVSGTRGPLLDSFRLSYPAVTTEPGSAWLTRRRTSLEEPVPMPADSWALTDSRTLKLLPDGTRPEPGTLYDLHYKARDPKILGIGFAATRDIVSFLRNEATDAGGIVNPVRRAIRSVLAIGISQSGRYLRDHISQGFNQDETGRKVFDGVLAHISGVGGVFLNAEFAQPGRTNTRHEDHLFPENSFPFAATAMIDPATGRSGSLLRGDGFDPLLIQTNTSTEYRQKGASLLHTDPSGQHDIPQPSTARLYMIAGTQHGGQAGLTIAPGPCANPRNPHASGPALRALLIALDQWVSDGTAPPESRVPTLADRTLIPPADLAYPEIPGIRLSRDVNPIAVISDWITPKTLPVAEDEAYRVLVPQVDADGNEVAGIRLPAIAVPVATYTGWNVYKTPFPEGQLCDRDGTYAAFARTRAERVDGSDPRPSLEERYGTTRAYADKVAAAADDLVKARLLLREDADRMVAEAKASKLLD